MVETTQHVRAFIALNLPPALKATLAALQRDLQKAPGGRAVRWTAIEQIHLTLRFLGDVPAEAVSEIQEALRPVTAALAPFDLEARGLGCFPNARQPRIVWVGVTGAVEPLRQLQAEALRVTAPWGELEDRPFHPHLTIGRVKKEQAGAARPLAAALEGKSTLALGAWRVGQVDLMQSRLAPSGAEYTLLAGLPLGSKL